jgi:hypothetical protein
MGADVASVKASGDVSFSIGSDEILRPVQISLWAPSTGFLQQNDPDEAALAIAKKQKSRIWSFALETAEKISLQRKVSVVVLGADNESCKDIFKITESNPQQQKLMIDLESCNKTKDLSLLAFSRAFLGSCRGDPSNPLVKSLLCKTNTAQAREGNANPFALLAAEQISNFGTYDAPVETLSVQIFPQSGLDSRLYPASTKPTAAALHKSGIAERSLVLDVTNQKECAVGLKETEQNLATQLRIETQGTALPVVCENWDTQQAEIILKIMSSSRRKIALSPDLKSKPLLNVKIGEAVVSPASYRVENGDIEFLQDPTLENTPKKITINFKN